MHLVIILEGELGRIGNETDLACFKVFVHNLAEGTEKYAG